MKQKTVLYFKSLESEERLWDLSNEDFYLSILPGAALS